MSSVGVLNVEALDQGVADGGVLDDPAHVVEVCLGIQRFDDAFESLAIIGRTKIIETRCGASAILEFVSVERHRPNLSRTARRRISRMDARSSAVTFAVSEGNSARISPTGTTRVVGVGAVLVRTQRRMMGPLLWPGVSSRFAIPGSSAHNTTRTRPSESTTA